LINFSLDIDDYMKVSDPSVPAPAVICEEPLKDIDVTNSDAFDEWIFNTKELLKNKIVLSVRARISACYENREFEELADSLKMLLRIEPCDEDSILELMDIYIKTGRRREAALLYKNYEESLQREIGIEPSKRVKERYEKILPRSCTVSSKADSGEKFWCRRAELAFMSSAMQEDESFSKAVFVHGEAGIGKTSLINRALCTIDEKKTVILASKSFSLGDGYPYCSWNNIMAQIGSLLEEYKIYTDSSVQSILSAAFPGFLKNRRTNYNTDIALMAERNPFLIGEMISSLVSKLLRHKRVIMVFEDIHWFDAQSLQLLTTFMEEMPLPVTLIISSRPESSKITLNMLRNIKSVRRWKIASLALASFRRDEITAICSSSLSGDIFKDRGEEYFVRESEGIPLLLFEMLRALNENPDSDCTKGLGGLIMARIGELAELQKDILEILSVFEVGAEPGQVADVLCRPLAEITPSAEDLISKNLVTEKSESGKATWHFIHDKVRVCIYESISLSKREELHAKAAEVLNKTYSLRSWNPILNAMLCHHYIKSGQRVKELRQYIQELIFDITLNHDIFPVVTDKVLLSCSSPFSSREESEAKIRHTIEILEEISTRLDVSAEEYAQLEATCFELAGGYHVSWGEYEKGKIYINRAIKLSEEYGFAETHIHCLKHRAYMFIQTENHEKLRLAAREIIKLARSADMMHYVATAVRFVGMSFFMSGETDAAEKIFSHTIKLFDNLKITGKSYTLGSLVASCYIGEIYRMCGDYSKAMSYFLYCVETTEKMGLYWGRSYFLTHAADLAFDIGDYGMMAFYIDKASSFFESCQGGRCGSILYSLKAVSEAQRGRMDLAIA
ncbi:MAG: AAA family ATPase, partial [Synergistaceae bacterium]